jgi:hypothetical protein
MRYDMCFSLVCDEKDIYGKIAVFLSYTVLSIISISSSGNA